jgi:hypothetical protein
MLANIFISLILLPQLLNTQLNFEGFLALAQNQDIQEAEQIVPQRIYSN